MQKVFEGNVVTVKMQKTVLVNIERKVAHPLYKKLIKKNKKIMADTGDMKIEVGNRVKIGETKPISKYKRFKVLEVIGKWYNIDQF